MKNLKLVIWAVIVLVVVWLGYRFWSQSSEKTVSPDTTAIGFMGPLSGDAAAYGEPYRRMIELAVEEVNNEGGIDGKFLEVIYEDSKCNGKDGANAAQKLINVDKVRVIIGPFCSSESLAAIPVAEAAAVALLSPGASSPDLTGKSRFFSRNYPSDATQGKVLAEAANQRGWKKVAVLQEQSDYPLGIYKAFSENFEKLGGTVVKEEFPTNTTDFRSLLTKLKAEKPDALLIDPQTPANGERSLKQLSDLKWKPALMINDAVAGDPKTIENNKDILEGALAAEFGVDPENPKFQHAIQAYKDKYGEEPPFQSYAQTEYDAVFLVRDALLAVGYDGAAVADWYRTVVDWEGASGLTTIGSDGDRVGGHVLKIVKNGKVEVLK